MRETAFAEAIARDPGDPLPWLGLGLAVHPRAGGSWRAGNTSRSPRASAPSKRDWCGAISARPTSRSDRAADAAAQFELSQERLDPAGSDSVALRRAPRAGTEPPGARLPRRFTRARALNDNRLDLPVSTAHGQERRRGLAEPRRRIFTDLRLRSAGDQREHALDRAPIRATSPPTAFSPTATPGGSGTRARVGTCCSKPRSCNR